jgi:type III secretion protein U
MSGKDDSGDKSEKATPKKLRDARKKGEVSKSKDLSSTWQLAIWLLLFWLMTTHIANEFAALFDASFSLIAVPGNMKLAGLGEIALRTFAVTIVPILLTVGLIGSLGDFFQVGPIMTTEKMKFDLGKLNPVSGLKRVFSLDNLFEVAKSILKILVLGVITWAVAKEFLPYIIRLPLGNLNDTLVIYHRVILWFLSMSVLIFFFISMGDAGYQKFSFGKKMRMSMRDIRQEYKEDEGDPYVKQRRKQLHQEWSQQNTMQAVKKSSVLVVNPTHIAIAIEYSPEIEPIPLVSAKGEDYLVPLMKDAAIAAGVPIIRHVPLARRLNALAEIDEYVPQETFEAVAEVIRWAAAVREGILDGESGLYERAVNEDFILPSAPPTQH